MHPANILVVEDNAITRGILCVALRSAHYIVREAADGQSALAMIRENPPDLVLQDLLLPDMDGIELLSKLRQIGHAAAIPVLACSGHMSKVDEARNLQATFTDYLFKPLDLTHLLQLVQRYLPIAAPVGDKPGRARRVILVDDDPVQLKLNARQLAELEFTVTSASSGVAALEMAERDQPDAFIVDLLMPGMSGVDVCLAIRRNPKLADLPVIVASSTFAVIDDEDRAMVRGMGASALVARTPALEEVVAALLASFEERYAPPLAIDADQIRTAFVERLMHQLEHQSAVNHSFARRVAMDAALLSVTVRTAALVNEHLELPQLLHDVLAGMLDAGGVSMGAIYVMNADGNLRVMAQLGFSGDRAEGLADFFGDPGLLHRMTRDGRMVSLPSNYFEWEAEAALLERIGTHALLVVPLVVRGSAEGVLIISTSKYQLRDEWLASVQAVGAQVAQAIALTRTLDQLTASEARYRSLFEGVPTGVYRALPNGRILDANPALLDLLGYDDRAAVLAMSIAALYVDPEDGRRWRETLLSDGIVHGFEAQMRRRDGSPIWVSTSARLVRGETGAVQHCEGAAIDITERKQAEARLASSEAYYRFLFDASPMPMWVVNAESNAFLAVNESALHLYGYTRDEFLGMSVRNLWAPTSDIEARLEEMRNSPDSASRFSRVQHKKRNNDVIDMEITSTGFSFEGRSARLVLGHDVTERKQLERRFLHAQKMEAIGQLAGGIAHDFNNLLTVIKGCGELLQESMRTSAFDRENIDEVVKAANRAAVLTRQLLVFSRRQLFDPRPLDLNVAVADMEKMLRRLVTEDIEIRTMLEPGLGVVKVDAGQIEQVIANIVVNARDAMPHGGHLTIATANVALISEDVVELAAPGAGSYVRLSISDTGLGMDEATRQRIFEPFFTTKQDSHGTGLGLSTAYGIVKQSDGYIRVQSELGHGTTFEIYLPRVDSAPERHAVEPAPIKQLRGSERILVVEDDAAVRAVVTIVLKSLGYSITEARDGQEALSIASGLKEEPALVMTDIVMPRMNGHKLVTELRHRWPSLRVLFMSGYSEAAATGQQVLPQGASFIEKPFLPTELARRVRETLEAPLG